MAEEVTVVAMAATNPNGTVTIGYDNRSRISSVTDVFGQVVGYKLSSLILWAVEKLLRSRARYV
jgi:YD repeat-containing protein